MFRMKLIFVVIVLFFCSKATNADDIISSDSAITLALAYTGFENTIGFGENKILKPAKENVDHIYSFPSIEFLFYNREAWVVEFKSITLNYFNNHTVKNETYIRDFKVYIDCKSGNLLKIISPHQIEGFLHERDLWKDKAGGFCVESLKTASIAKTMPDFDFLKVIEGRGSYLTPYSSEEIEAYLIEIDYEEGYKIPDISPSPNTPFWLMTTKFIKVGRGQEIPKEREKLLPLLLTSSMIIDYTKNTYAKTEMGDWE